jgi:hypothetical protein
VRAFKIPHSLHIGKSFSGFSGISNPHSNLGFGASSLLDLVSFSDADFAGCGIDRKNTSDTCHFLRSSLVCWSSHK